MLSQYKWNSIQIIFLLSIISSLPGTSARGYDPQSCCMQAYLNTSPRDSLPWDVCLPKFRNATEPYPVIEATVGWCKANCGSGSKLNDKLEWLTPLSTWIFPMLVLLANLPYGDLPRRYIRKYRRLEFVQGVWPYIEWITVLGDPASAFCAAYSTLVKDFVISYALLKSRYRPDSRLSDLDRSLLGLAMVASRTRPEEYILSAFLPASFSRLISEYLMNPDIHDATDELRDNLFKLRNDLDNRNIKILFPFKPSREMLEAFEQSDTRGNTLRAQLQIFEKLLEKYPQPDNKREVEKPGLLKEDFHSIDDDNAAPNLSKTVIACNEAWAKIETSATEAPIFQEPAPEHDEIERTVVDAEDSAEDSVGENGDEENSSSRVRGSAGRVLPSTSLKFVIQAIRRSRDNFVTAIAFPMVIVFATLIGTFSSAYRQLGDEDTAQGIAYGTWYMWILILSVSSNTTASSAKTLFVTDALRTGANIRRKQIFVESVIARNAYGNNANWFRWLEDAGVPKLHRIGILGPKDNDGLEEEAVASQVVAASKEGEAAPVAKRDSHHSEFRFRSFVWYVIWQFVGWVWVGFACANAAAVAFTTPTVGLGCRSFNHVLYAGGTLIAAMLRVFKRETYEKKDAYPGMVSRDKSLSSRAQLLFRVLYHIVSTLNILILVLGTIFQISGIYNNCKCQALFGDDNSMIDITTHTIKSRDNAARYWLSMAYVAYTTAWIACGLAISARAFVFYILDNEFRDDEQPEESEGIDGIAYLTDLMEPLKEVL